MIHFWVWTSAKVKGKRAIKVRRVLKPAMKDPPPLRTRRAPHTPLRRLSASPGARRAGSRTSSLYFCSANNCAACSAASSICALVGAEYSSTARALPSSGLTGYYYGCVEDDKTGGLGDAQAFAYSLEFCFQSLGMTSAPSHSHAGEAGAQLSPSTSSLSNGACGQVDTLRSGESHVDSAVDTVTGFKNGGSSSGSSSGTRDGDRGVVQGKGERPRVPCGSSSVLLC